MKAKELEDLAEAVRTENHRLYALQQQRKYGIPPIHAEVLTSYPRPVDSGNAALFQKPPEQFLELNTEGIDWERVASTVGVSVPFKRTDAMAE